MPEAQVLTLRLEQFTLDFDRAAARLATHVGIAPHCIATAVQSMQKHDVGRWSTEDQIAHPHVQHPEQVSMSEPWRNATALHRVLNDDPYIRTSLMRFGRDLGYSYSS